jgi:hypothetical protein
VTIFQLIEFIDVTVLVAGGTLCVTEPHSHSPDEHLAAGVMSVDTVGELGSVENRALRMASCKAHDHGNACAERLACEGGNRFANSISVGFGPYRIRDWGHESCPTSVKLNKRTKTAIGFLGNN